MLHRRVCLRSSSNPYDQARVSRRPRRAGDKREMKEERCIVGWVLNRQTGGLSIVLRGFLRFGEGEPPCEPRVTQWAGEEKRLGRSLALPADQTLFKTPRGSNVLHSTLTSSAFGQS